MAVNYTREQMLGVFEEARAAAVLASKEYFAKELGGKDSWPCGFAWVELYGVDGRSKMGKLLKELDVHSHLWNPSRMGVQNMDTLYAGARAYADVLQKYGFRAYPASRMD